MNPVCLTLNGCVLFKLVGRCPASGPAAVQALNHGAASILRPILALYPQVINGAVLQYMALKHALDPRSWVEDHGDCSDL